MKLLCNVYLVLHLGLVLTGASCLVLRKHPTKMSREWRLRQVSYGFILVENPTSERARLDRPSCLVVSSCLHFLWLVALSFKLLELLLGRLRSLVGHRRIDS